MASFQTQVMGLTGINISSSGTNPTEAQLTQFLTDGAKEVLNSLPRSKQEMFTTSNELNSSSTNLTLLGSEVFSVTRDDSTINQPCRKVSSNLNGRIRDSGDMMAATATDPAYYVSNNILSVVPEPSNSNNAHVQTLAYPTVAYSDSEVGKFPDDGEYLIPLYASVKSLQNKMSSKTSDLPTDVTLSNLPIIPVAPASPSFNTGALAMSGATAPTYTKPSFVAPTLGSIGSMNLPVKPTAPTLTSNSVSFTETAPDYIAPVVSPSFSTVDTFIATDEDVELASVKIQEISQQINEYQANIQSQLNVFNDDNNEYQAKLKKAIKDADLSQADDSQNLQKYSNEIQLYQAEVSKEVQRWQGEELNKNLQVFQSEFSNKLQEYSTNIQNELNEFNKENTVFRNQLEEEVQEAKNQQTKDSSEYGAKIQKYSNALQSYQAELQSYQADASTKIQNYSAKIQKHSTDYQWLAGQYQQLKADYNQGLQKLIS